MRRVFFFIVAIVVATSSFASIPRASMLDRASEDASPLVAALSDTRIRASDVLAPTANNGTDLRNGKLIEAVRKNYVPDHGTVEVRETYKYESAGGRPTERDTTVTGNASFAGASFTHVQSWTDLGQLNSVTYPATPSLGAPSRVITNQYAAGRLTGVGGYATIAYQPNGLVAAVTHGSGSTAVTETWTPDDNGMARPKRISVSGPAGLSWTYGDYSYDAAGNITAIGTTSYDYDAMSRLVGWTESVQGSSVGTQRELDAFGNYITAFSTACNVLPSNVSPRGRMQCYTSGTLKYEPDAETNHDALETYDDGGNVTNDRIYTFAYDAAAMITSLTGSGRDERYLYTADDERIATIDRGTNKKTIWTLRGTDNRLLRTFTRSTLTGTTDWSWTEDEIWRGSQLLASESAAGRKQYHLDHLGSPRLVTNSSGGRIGEQTFDPFGVGGTSDGGRIQFTGHELDVAPENAGFSLMYMHARYYAPGRGRFLSVDPVLDVKKATRNPQNWNRYAYVMNNPINRIDPDGRDDGMVGLTVMQDCQLNDCRPNWEEDRKVASMGLSLMPLGIGDAYDAASAVTGRDYVGGEQVGTFARIAGLLPFVSTGAVQRVIKAINLPAWKSVGIDMVHIVARHTPGGAQTSERASKFVGMSEKQIETAVRQAYRYGKQVGSQGDRVRVVGEYGKMQIEMWVNKKTKTIETAYPVQ